MKPVIGHIAHTGQLVIGPLTMSLLPTSWSVISSFLIFVASIVLMVALSHRLSHSTVLGAGLYLWHTLFCVVYASYVVEFGGDATGYYARAVEGPTTVELGTRMVDVLASLIIAATSTSFLGVSLAFNLAGAVGLLLLYDVLDSTVGPTKGVARSLVWPVVLMPSASFWSAGLGKDSIAFMAAVMVTWAAVDQRRRRVALGAAIVTMFLVRPHMASLMLAMLLVTALGSPRKRIADRIAYTIWSEP